MKKSIFSSKLHRSSFFVYLGVFACFCVLLFVLYGYLVVTTLNAGQKNQEELTEKTSTQVEAFLSELDRIALQVMGNTAIGEIFEDIPYADENYFNQNAMKKQSIQKALLGINGPTMSVGRISIFNSRNDYVSYGSYQEDNEVIVNYLSHIQYEKLLEKIREKKRKKMAIKVHEDSWSRNGGMIVSVYRPLTRIASNKDRAIIETQTRLEKLYELIALKSLENVDLSVYDFDGNMIYPEVKEDAMDNLEVLENYNPEAGKSFSTKMSGNKKAKQKGLLTVKTGQDYMWTVTAWQESGNMMRGAKNFLAGLLILLLSVMILMMVWLFFMSKRMAEPLIQLNQSLSDVTLHNMAVTLENQEDMDVVDSLNQGFQVMFERLGRSIENEMDANLLALQAQMNPHFLYNVLSVIGSAGMENQGMKVAVLCGKLSKMLRYSSSYEYRVVSLKEETEYAEMYLDLMQARYEKKFQYQIVTSGPMEEVKVPKIMIQPMVENCFRHAFINAEYLWKIEINIHVDERLWSVKIQDNGCGFSVRKREEIERQVETVLQGELNLKQLKIEGLGLANTIARLKLLYGDKVYYKITSQEHGAVLQFTGERL